MINDANITVLTTIASAAFALALLGAVSALWPHSPSQEGLANFAFALATALSMVLGNLAVFGAYLLTKNKSISRVASPISGCLSAAIFVIGLVTSSVLFTEGLNAWFTDTPMMPPPLILFVRWVILISVVWFFLSVGLRLFSKDKAETPKS